MGSECGSTLPIPSHLITSSETSCLVSQLLIGLIEGQCRWLVRLRPISTSDQIPIPHQDSHVTSNLHVPSRYWDFPFVRDGNLLHIHVPISAKILVLECQAHSIHLSWYLTIYSNKKRANFCPTIVKPETRKDATSGMLSKTKLCGCK